MFAAYNGQVEMVKLLLEKNANIQGEEGNRVISAAACWLYHSDKKAEHIATYKAMIDKLRDNGIARDILTAVMLNETEVLRKLVKDKPDLLSSKVTWLHYRDKHPILIVAVMMDSKEIVGAVLDAGAPIEEKDDGGDTALHAAAYADSKEIAKLLISRKADLNSRDKNRGTPLYVAAHYGCVEVAKLLIAAGADIHARDDQGLTPLHMVTGNEEVAKVLLAAGAKVNARDDRARTPLHLAAEYVEPGLIKLLIAHGADVKAKDNQGKTPLHVAATDGTVDVAKQLIDSGADINAKDNEGKTPLASVDESYIRMIEFLQKYGGK
jgi:ankyrin repeat protein